MAEKSISISFERQASGYSILSADMPELILFSRDADAVRHDLQPAVETLVARNEGRNVRAHVVPAGSNDRLEDAATLPLGDHRMVLVPQETVRKPLPSPPTAILPAVAGNGAVGVVGGDPVPMPQPKP